MVNTYYPTETLTTRDRASYAGALGGFFTSDEALSDWFDAAYDAPSYTVTLSPKGLSGLAFTLTVTASSQLTFDVTGVSNANAKPAPYNHGSYSNNPAVTVVSGAHGLAVLFAGALWVCAASAESVNTGENGELAVFGGTNTYFQSPAVSHNYTASAGYRASSRGAGSVFVLSRLMMPGSDLIAEGIYTADAGMTAPPIGSMTIAGKEFYCVHSNVLLEL